MSRTIKDKQLDSRSSRAKLKAQAQPHYRQLIPGLHFGYRKGTTGGRWVMRRRIGEGYSVETIGTADDRADADGAKVLSYEQAQQKALALAAERNQEEAGVKPKKALTVGQVVEDYLKWLDRNRKSAKNARRGLRPLRHLRPRPLCQGLRLLRGPPASSPSSALCGPLHSASQS